MASSTGRRGLAFIVAASAAAVLVIAAGVGCLVQLRRILPSTVVSVSLPSSYTLPGPAPRLPWPTAGQGSLEVEGIGSIGSYGSSAPVPIASVAKIMTAYIVLADHPMAANANGPSITITAAQVADYQADVAADNSAVMVTAGERLTERQALEALLIPSGDNIARVLATWDAGSKAAFLLKMNKTAAGLGMHDTVYTDPSGLAASTVSTASDQVKLASKAIVNTVFAKIVAIKRVSLPVAGTVRNYNALLGKDGIIGVKTGSTSAAGGCLVFAARHTVAGHTYTFVGAVFGQGHRGPFANVLPRVMAATRSVMTAAEAIPRSYRIVSRGQLVASLHGPFGANTTVVAGANIEVTGWPGLTFPLRTQITAPRRAPAGATLGTITVSGPVGVDAIDGNPTSGGPTSSGPIGGGPVGGAAGHSGSQTATCNAVSRNPIRPPTLWQRVTRR